MSLRINHNIAAINGHRNLLRNDMAVSSSLEKLSSGLRINRAADDAAGLVISEQMRAQISGLDQAVDNSEAAISMVQTAEGALDEVNSLLNKARELVLHAANTGANDVTQLAADQAELDNVIKSITRISEVTQFGTKKLLDGTLNGSSALSAGLTRVDVGNLANNPAVATGLVTIDTTGYILESHALNGGAITDDAYLFSSSGISGIQEVTPGLIANNGTSISVTINGTSYGTTSTGVTVGTLVNTINAQLSGADLGFQVTICGAGGMNVTRTDTGSTDFTSSISFSRNASPTAQDALSTATIDAVAGTNENAASAIFGEASLATVTTATAFTTSGTILNAQIQGSGGTTNLSYTVLNGDTVQDALNGLLTAISGAGSLGTGLDASTFSFAASTSALEVTLDSNNQSLEAITFNLEIDFPSNPTAIDEEVAAFALTTVGNASQRNTLFNTSGATLVTGSTTAATELASGTIMNLDVDGHSFTISGTAGGLNLDATAAAMQTQLDAVFSGTIRIAAIQGNTANAFGMATASMDSDPTTAPSFLIARNNNDSTSLTGTTISFENIALTGTDLAATFAAANDGSGVLASTYNLDTASNTSQSGMAAHAASTLASITGSTVVTSGNEGVTATVTTSNGVVLDMISSGAVSTGNGAQLVLSSASGNAGYQGLTLEIDGASAIALNSNLNFMLDDGATFQIGANAGQRDGLTIADINANELGRNVANSGPLTSLNDLTSSEQSALTNGLADEALHVIDASIDQITNLRGDLGAFQANILETGLNSLRVSSENLTAAESTIRDVDFAAESAQFTRNNIMVQASTAMLAQANQLPENVLQLLG